MIVGTTVKIHEKCLTHKPEDINFKIATSENWDYVEITFLKFTLQLCPEKAKEIGEALIQFANRHLNRGK